MRSSANSILQIWPGNFSGETRTTKRISKPLADPAIDDARPSPDDGACDVLAVPQLPADHQPVFWHPSESSAIVVLEAAPSGFGALPYSPEDWPGDVARIALSDGVHFVVSVDNTRYRLWAIGPPQSGAPLAAVIPLDAGAQRRTEATLLFLQLVAGGHPTAGRSPGKRLARMLSILRALDGHLSGASYRAIAEGLSGAKRVSEEAWRTSSLRDSIIRLVRAGIALKNGGYRDLLSARLRK